MCSGLRFIVSTIFRGFLKKATGKYKPTGKRVYKKKANYLTLVNSVIITEGTTKIMTQTKNPQIRQSLTVGEFKFENVTDFTYVGGQICQGSETRLTKVRKQ